MAKKKYRSIVKRIIIGVFSVILFSVLLVVCVFFNEIRTVISVEKKDDYGLYTMKYYGDYYFDEFLEEGAKTPDEIEQFIVRHMTKGLPIRLNMGGGLCSTFVAHNEKGDVIFCRNFDYTFSPSAVVTTTPKDGFASIGVADMAFAGYTRDNIPEGKGIEIENWSMLSAPYLIMDGMNEKGVAISCMTVPIADAPVIEGAPTLNTCTMMRMVLENAASVDEAIEHMKKYNVFWYGEDSVHFMVADATGKAVVVEYIDGELVEVESDKNFHIATNFNLYNDLRCGVGHDRYMKIEETLTENNGVLTDDQALDLLKRANIGGRTQWSVLYNLTTGEVKIYPHSKRDAVQTMNLTK